MSDYAVYNCTVRGARYVDKDKPCEDASISYSHDGIHIAVIADGHGDKTCFRSNVGSEIACRIAMESMLSFATILREQDAEDRVLGRECEKLVDQLFRAILGRWTSEVLLHLENNPPTDEEYETTGSENAAIYRSGRGLPHIYGTTLIAMLVTETYALVLHQGDGRCVVFHENGEIDQPVPWDPRCEGRNTASLCDDDVLEHWRFHIIDMRSDHIIGCYAMSDGIEDSFETMAEANAYIGMLTSEYLSMGREAYLTDLPDHFSLLSRSGSRDDVSIGCILNTKSAAEYAPKYSLVHEYYVAQGENRRANERLNSMKRKTEYLAAQLESARVKCEQSTISHVESKTLLEKIREALAAAVTDVEVRSQQKSDAEVALETAQKEYDDYMSVRAQFVEKADVTRKKMEELKTLIKELPKQVTVAEEAEEQETEDEPIYIQPADEYVGFEEESEASQPSDENEREMPQEDSGTQNLEKVIEIDEKDNAASDSN